MSYDYRTTRRTTTYNRPGARRGYFPPPPPPGRGSSSHHSLFGYWLPVVVTGTLAIGGLAAWIWSERSEHDEDDYPHDKPPRPQTGAGQPYPTQGSQPYPGPPGQQYQGPPPGQQGYPPSGPAPPPPPGGEASTYYSAPSDTRDVSSSQQQDATWYGRATGMMKRTPSPQQFLGSATKQVGAGLAAAGAALGSIIEGGSDDDGYDERRDRRKRESGGRSTQEEVFSDHEHWSEEADGRQTAVEAESERRADNARAGREDKGKGRAKRAVAVVVSADTGANVGYGDDNADFRTEHASILSHLPSQHDSDTTDLFVLICAPGLKALPPLDYRPDPNVISTMGSSYSQISTPAATPGSELQSMSPRVDAADAVSKQFDALYAQALALVSSPEQILPFTTADGYVHILRHLAPQLVYISDTLSGDEGESIAQLKGWVGHTILVAGDEGHGGLADTETEDELPNDDGRKERKSRWYEDSNFVGLGKEVEVVDAVRVGEDWSRRVGGRE